MDGQTGYKQFIRLVIIYLIINLPLIKGALCNFGQDILMERKCLNKLNNTTLVAFLSEQTEINKLTLKDNTVSYCFTSFKCGGPCHLSSFTQCSGNLIFF